MWSCAQEIDSGIVSVKSSDQKIQGGFFQLSFWQELCGGSHKGDTNGQGAAGQGTAGQGAAGQRTAGQGAAGQGAAGQTAEGPCSTIGDPTPHTLSTLLSDICVPNKKATKRQN